MTCVLCVPIEHVQDWPDTPQQLVEAVKKQLGEAPRVQYDG